MPLAKVPSRGGRLRSYISKYLSHSASSTRRHNRHEHWIVDLMPQASQFHMFKPGPSVIATSCLVIAYDILSTRGDIRF